MTMGDLVQASKDFLKEKINANYESIAKILIFKMKIAGVLRTNFTGNRSIKISLGAKEVLDKFMNIKHWKMNIPNFEAVNAPKILTEGEYVIRKILEKSLDDDGKYYYLIEWEGCGSDENSWEPEENISAAAIEKFEREQKKLYQVEKIVKIERNGNNSLVCCFYYALLF